MSDIPMKNLSAVILAAHPWSGIPYGLHHIARALARLGWKVLYIEPHFSPLHLVGGRRRGRVFGREPRLTDEPDVFVVSPFALAPHANLPLLRSSATLRLAKHLSWPRLDMSYLAHTSFVRPDLVLCGSPAATDIALSLNARTSLYRLADDSRLFDVLTPAVRLAESDAISRFDGIIVTSSRLEERAHELNARRVFLVSNGVDRAFFERASLMPAILADLPEPRILYAGAVESWFDWQLVTHAARARTNYSFAIVGRVRSPAPSALPPNVHLIGPRPYSEMPAFMQAASVGIIPFASTQHGEAVAAINPLKLYEYLAAGRPVVSSVRPPNLNSEGLFIYADQAEFLMYLDEAVTVQSRKVKIRAPEHVDWAHIVSTMLNDLEFAAPSCSPIN